MARLNAGKRTEVVRLEKEQQVIDSDLITWERVTLAVMSDGKILRKRDVLFRPDDFHPKGRRHSWGWKVAGKLPAGWDAVRFAQAYQAYGFAVRGAP